jgi:hypothetical protein
MLKSYGCIGDSYNSTERKGEKVGILSGKN